MTTPLPRWLDRARLEELLTKHGWSYVAVGEELDLSGATVYQYVKRAKIPRPAALRPTGPRVKIRRLSRPPPEPKRREVARPVRASPAEHELDMSEAPIAQRYGLWATRYVDHGRRLTLEDTEEKNT